MDDASLASADVYSLNWAPGFWAPGADGIRLEHVAPLGHRILGH